MTARPIRSSCAALLLAALIAMTPTPARAQTMDSGNRPIVIVATFDIAPGREAQFRERSLAFARMAQEAVPGVVYRLHLTTGASPRFVFYEYFPSKAAYDRVQGDVAAAHRERFGPTPAGLFASPPSIQQWEPLN